MEHFSFFSSTFHVPALATIESSSFCWCAASSGSVWRGSKHSVFLCLANVQSQRWSFVCEQLLHLSSAAGKMTLFWANVHCVLAYYNLLRKTFAHFSSDLRWNIPVLVLALDVVFATLICLIQSNLMAQKHDIFTHFCTPNRLSWCNIVYWQLF